MKFGKLLKDLTDGNPQMSEQPLIRYKELKKHLKNIKKQQESAPEGSQQGQSAAAAAAASGAAMAVQHQQDHPQAEAQPGQGLPPGLSGEEQAFINMLNEDLLRFNRFFMDKEEEAVIKLQALADRIATTAAQGQQQQQQQETQDLKAALVDFHGEMVLLLHWSLLNYAAVVKILKKHDKQSGLLLRAPYLANVLQQPFYSTSIMSQLVKMAEGHLDTLVAQEAKHTAAAPPPPAAAATAAGSSQPEAADPQAAGSSHQANTAAGPSAAPAPAAGPGPSPEAAAAEADRSNQTTDGLPTAAAAATPAGMQPVTAAAATPAGGAAAAAGDGSGSGSAPEPESDSDTEELLASTAVCARTRVALQTWQQLCSNASTPSTVLPANSSQALVRALNVRQRWAKLVALAPIMQQAGMDAAAAAEAAVGYDGVGADGAAVVGGATSSDAAAEQQAGKGLEAAAEPITHQQQLQELQPPQQQQSNAKEVEGLHAGQKHKSEASQSDADISKRQRLDS